jgi:hypothetical protein
MELAHLARVQVSPTSNDYRKLNFTEACSLMPANFAAHRGYVWTSVSPIDNNKVSGFGEGDFNNIYANND